MKRAWILLGLFPFAALAQGFELETQVRVLDELGEPADGTLPVVISLYRDAGGVDELWSRSYTPDFDGGYASLTLSGGTPTLSTEVLAGGDVYLGIAVNGADDLLPRNRLAHVPFAAVAQGVRVDPAPGTSCSSAGQLVFDTTANVLRVCNGSTWQTTGNETPRQTVWRATSGSGNWTGSGWQNFTAGTSGDMTVGAAPFSWLVSINGHYADDGGKNMKYRVRCVEQGSGAVHYLPSAAGEDHYVYVDHSRLEEYTFTGVATLPAGTYDTQLQLQIASGSGRYRWDAGYGFPTMVVW